MGSTGARKPVPLNPSVLGSLRAVGFSLVREASMAAGPALYSHPLAPAMRLSVSQSERTSTAVIWRLTQLPDNLHLDVQMKRGDPDEFDRAMSHLRGIIVGAYSGGVLARVAGETQDDVYTDSATQTATEGGSFT